MKPNTFYLILGILALILIIYIGPKTGLFAAENFTFPCPEESLTDSPCIGAAWIDTPRCYWNVSKCENYCESDAACNIELNAQNDCTLFFQPHKVPQIGYCKSNFCQWQQIPQGTTRECTSFEMFTQEYKWYILGLIILIVGYGFYEVDWGGRKRGLIKGI